CPPLRDPKEFRLVSKRLPRLDSADKIAGRATFGIDVRLPGMLRAAVARPPTLGGRLAGFDDRAARAVPGVRAVHAIESGVAVVAENTWAGLAGRGAPDVRWQAGPTAPTAELHEAPRRALDGGDFARRTIGDAAGQLARAARRLDATYTLPFLAHAAMEPINCT